METFHLHFAYYLDILYCKVSGNSSANNELVAKTFRICKNFPVSIADTLTGFFWLWTIEKLFASPFLYVLLMNCLMLRYFRVTKTPSACQQCWPESFCKSGKFLRQVHYWLKNFWILCNTKYPDNMQSVRMNWKVSGQSKKCPDNLENVSG